MPLPKRLARFNLAVTNRVLGPPARRLPGFAVVEHVGRRSGGVYRTPVNLFRVDGRYVFALTYGADAQWVRNVQAAGGARVQTRGRWLALTDPEIVHDPERRMVPAPVRLVLGLVDVEDFLVMRQGETRATATSPE